MTGHTLAGLTPFHSFATIAIRSDQERELPRALCVVITSALKTVIRDVKCCLSDFDDVA